MLKIAYDGSVFSGWQRQPNAHTVQGHIEKVMSSLFKKNIVINGTSRTDAGVHALDQRASFKTDITIPIEKLSLVVNNALASYEKGSFAISPVRILDAAEMPADFHARFDCKGKKYIYKIFNGEQVNLFDRNYVYHVNKKLNVAHMKAAAEKIVGTHDFKSFESSGGNPRETTVRTVFDLNICEGQGDFEKNGKSIEISVTGDGFLYNMVRIITGTLVDIGLGRIDFEQMNEIITSCDRRCAGHTAPPFGLYLAQVYYDKDEIERS